MCACCEVPDGLLAVKGTLKRGYTRLCPEGRMQLAYMHAGMHFWTFSFMATCDRSLEPICRFTQEIIRCTMSYITVPVVDLGILRKAKARGKGRGRGRGRGAPKAKNRKPKKDGVPAAAIVHKRWPIYAPHRMLEAIAAADALHLVTLACMQEVNVPEPAWFALFFMPARKGDVDWLEFWESAKMEPWGSLLLCNIICSVYRWNDGSCTIAKFACLKYIFVIYAKPYKEPSDPTVACRCPCCNCRYLCPWGRRTGKTWQKCPCDLVVCSWYIWQDISLPISLRGPLDQCNMDIYQFNICNTCSPAPRPSVGDAFEVLCIWWHKEHHLWSFARRVCEDFRCADPCCIMYAELAARVYIEWISRFC